MKPTAITAETLETGIDIETGRATCNEHGIALWGCAALHKPKDGTQ
ncbi:hypothetical protein [Streptosporangium jomthongense]|uniref:Uncharacterized protein n=1 Tax=Streptosporangium jomthongense TaxID=1193683 RepID=A0ABV8F437_9ACTN